MSTEYKSFKADHKHITRIANMKSKISKIHMVGIGGAGMSGIAEVLLNLGYQVTGSDQAQNEAIERLVTLGATIYQEHRPENVGDAEVVVKSTAIGPENSEVQKAFETGIPVIPRAEMLAELMRLKTGIAVAGTHGKTTTTSLLGTVFKEAGMDPTVIIGGRLNSYGSNALMGQGDYLIAEADESDGSFLCLLPIMSIVTNIDADHLDYYSDLQAIEDTFVEFLNKIPFYGVNVVCGDDSKLKRLQSRIKRSVFTYGFNPDNDLQAQIIDSGMKTEFRVFYSGLPWADIEISLPGTHNVLNTLAVIGLCLQVGMSKEEILKGLDSFGGVSRRLEFKGKASGVPVIDDYGHHPRELEVTIKTVKEMYPGKRVFVVFQPHRFSRTQSLFGEFCRAFNEADEILITDVYPAGEDPIPGVNGFNLSQGIKQVSKVSTCYCSDLENCLQVLKQKLAPGDVLLTLGAGNVYKLGESYINDNSG